MVQKQINSKLTVPNKSLSRSVLNYVINESQYNIYSQFSHCTELKW